MKEKHTSGKCDEEGEGHEENMECDECGVARSVWIVNLYIYRPIRGGSRGMPLEDLCLVDFGHGLSMHVHVCIVTDMNEGWSGGGVCQEGCDEDEEDGEGEECTRRCG